MTIPCDSVRWLAAVLMLCAAAFDAAAQAPAPAPAVQPRGLHVIFDASLSMCGFKLAGKTDQTLSNLFGAAREASDLEKLNNQVLLLKQAEPNPKGAADFTPLKPDMEQRISRGTDCNPFEGKGSELAQVFRTDLVKQPARSLVLVSDLQMGSEAQGRFVDAFRQWGSRAVAAGETIHAGFVTLNVPFSGPYYPVDTDLTKSAGGYTLPQFSRPLSIFWFVAGETDLEPVRKILQSVGISREKMPPNQLFGLQLLPVVTTSHEKWLLNDKPLRSAEQLFLGAPSISVQGAVKSSSSRWADCVRAAWAAKGALVLRTDKECNDGKPFTELLSSLEAKLRVDSSKGVSVGVKSENGRFDPGDKGLIVATLNRNEVAKRAPVKVALELVPAIASFESAKLGELTVRDDHCGGEVRPAKGAAPNKSQDPRLPPDRCIAKIQGKVYLYDSLVKLLVSRSRDVAEERIKAIPPELWIQFEKN